MTDRRAFLQFVMAAGGSCMHAPLKAQEGMEQFYDLPPFGNVTLLHITDLLDQWKPLYYREPAGQILPESSANRALTVSGDELLQYYNLMIGSAQAYAFSSADYEASSKDYGMLGGVAHLATLIQIVRKTRKHAVLMDGGNGATTSWAPWASKAAVARIRAELNIDLALPDGELITDEMSDGTSGYIARNLVSKQNDERALPPYSLIRRDGRIIAVVGQLAHNEARHPLTDTLESPDAQSAEACTEFDVQFDSAGLQKTVDEVRNKGAIAVVLLSRAGIDADLQLAAHVTGIDVILGGRSLTPLPEPITVKNKNGKTLVTNAGAQGRFLGVMDMQIGKRGVLDFRYNLLPVVQSFLPADRKMDEQIRLAYESGSENLGGKLSVTESLLYRRGSFNGSWDELLLDAMVQHTGADVAAFPGYRWGSTLLPGATITLEDVVEQTARGPEHIHVGTLDGVQIRNMLEAAAEDVFNRDPVQRTALDMLRTKGIDYTLLPEKGKGKRIADVMIGDHPLEPEREYRIAGWGVDLGAEASGEARVQDVLANYLRQKKTVSIEKTFRPSLADAEKTSERSEKSD